MTGIIMFRRFCTARKPAIGVHKELTRRFHTGNKENTNPQRKPRQSNNTSKKKNLRSYVGKIDPRSNEEPFKEYLKVDPRSITEFGQLIPKVLSKAIEPLIKTPTAIQKAVLSLKPVQSVIAQSYPGTGKSLMAALKAAMWAHTAPTTPFTSLILVPTPDLALQYTGWLHRIVPSTRVQHVFRASQEQELNQVGDITKSPPSILVATPQRVLDMIHQDGGSISLENIGFVAIDEAERLLTLSKRGSDKTRRLKNPADLLLSRIHQARGAVAPLRLLIIDSDISSSLVSQIKSSQWIGPQQILEVGQPTIAGSSLHANKLPRDVDFFAVNYDPKKKSLTNFDFQSLEYRDLFREDVVQFMKLTKPYVPAQSQLADYCEAFKHVFETSGRKKGLLLVPKEVSTKAVIEQLRSLGVVASLGNGIFLDRQNRDKSFDPGTMFLSSVGQNEEWTVPDVIVYDRDSVSGLDFPGLSHVYAMSWSAFNNSEHELVRAASRIRQIDATQRGERGKLGSSGGSAGKLIVIECIRHPDKLENINAQISIVLGKVDGELTRLPFTAKNE